METVLRVLILEDVPSDAELETAVLKRARIACETLRVATEIDFLEQLEKFSPDLVLSDFTLPDFDGLSALKIVCDRRPDVPLIMVSGSIGEEKAVEALKHISIAPGPMFSASDRYRNCVRLNCGCQWTPTIERSLARLGELAQNLARPAARRRVSAVR